MADNSNNILKHLQQYSIQPPADAFDKAWEKCMQESNAENSSFEALRNYSLEAPQVDLKKIMVGEKTTADNKKRFFFFYTPVRIAAAVILMVAAGLVLYLTVLNKKDEDRIYTTEEKIKNTPVAPVNDSIVLVSGSIPANKPRGNSNADDRGITKQTAKPLHISAHVHRNNSYSPTYIQNDESRLFNHDILYTLVTYRENRRDKWFYKALSAKKITLNQYSYINLSDKMVTMLQDLYVTKKNGKPSRKARKTKKMFEKWRKKDEKYFDKKPDKNPADIIDLSDFLMHN